MIKRIICLVLFVCSIPLHSQINGELLLGLNTGTTTEITNIINPVTGSLVYNTTDFSIYQYDGTSWVRIFDDANNGIAGTKVNYGARWTNTDTTTDLNVTNVIAPIFGTEDYNDDGTSLYSVSGNVLTIEASGRYEIKANLSYSNVNTARNNACARLAVNGTLIGARACSGYMRQAGEHTESSVHINETLNISEDDEITIVMFREGGPGSVNFSAVAESSFIINKLK